MTSRCSTSLEPTLPRFKPSCSSTTAFPTPNASRSWEMKLMSSSNPTRISAKPISRRWYILMLSFMRLFGCILLPLESSPDVWPKITSWKKWKSAKTPSSTPPFLASNITREFMKNPSNSSPKGGFQPMEPRCPRSHTLGWHSVEDLEHASDDTLPKFWWR